MMQTQQVRRKSPRKYTIQETIQVYTDWANHYLDKSCCKRHITDLQRDVTDGVLLAEVIEAATSQKIADVCRKPRTSAQMLENIQNALVFLAGLGVEVDGLTAREVHEGNLKTILGLFYALSRYKQQQKMQAERRRPEETPRLASPYGRSVTPVGSGIPMPNRTQPPKPSPSPSLIPSPRSSDSHSQVSVVKAAGLNSPYDSRNSMLDKLKVFHSKDKLKPGSNVSKRTSSSSGFSSARSDSSASLTAADVNKPEASIPPVPTGGDKSLSRGLRNKLRSGGNSAVPKRNSPKSTRKLDCPTARPSPKPLHRPREVQDEPKEVTEETKPARSSIVPPCVIPRMDNVEVASNNETSMMPKPMRVQRTVALVSPMPPAGADNMSESNSSDSSALHRSESSGDIVKMEPMDPLRTYTHRALLARTAPPCEGYSSDCTAGHCLPDVCDGYISEGGASLYARTIQAHRIINSFECESRSRLDTKAGCRQEDRPGSSKRMPARMASAKLDQSVSGGVVYRVVSSRVKKSDSSQQTDNSCFRQSQQASQSQQWRHYTDAGTKMMAEVSELQRGKSDLDASKCRPRKLGVRDDKSKVRGVPHSFGYVKRASNGNGVASAELRTAQVSAVPRTKVKVSDGTQTCSDLQHFKSYSLTGATASQLSHSIRERLMMGSQSLPKPGSSDYAALFRRVRPSDGSLSDTTYAELSDQHGRILSPRLNRSNSIRSTKSEKLYPSMLQRTEEPYYCLPVHASQPTSPTPSPTPRPHHSPTQLASSASACGLARATWHKPPSKDDDVHGSTASLVSSASSLYTTCEEKQAHEIRKLRRELQDAQEKVTTLTSQLNTNAHVVSAFEQSLSNMTQRLQQLTSAAERKDAELAEVRQALELVRQQSRPDGTVLERRLSAESVSSLSSACSHSSSQNSKKKKKKRGWLRSSFSRAFSRSEKNRNGSVSDVEDFRGPNSDLSAPSSPVLMPGSHSSNALFNNGGNENVAELRRQLREKDLVLTDIRLEALSSAHQLESLKDTVLKMRNEMLALKRDNERLKSPSETGSLERLELLHSVGDECDSGDGKKALVGVALPHGCVNVVGTVRLHPETAGQLMDSWIRRVFKDYVSQVDPTTSLGLSGDSVLSYSVAEPADSDSAPSGSCDVRVRLRGAAQGGAVDELAFDTLIPKAIIQRYVALLSEHRRIILCGPSGVGKSHLANKLAEFLVDRDGGSIETAAEAVATFNVEHKSSKQLRQYLSHVAEQCENNAADLPSVIILDNLHHAASLGELFNGFLSAKYNKCPYIIGTMNQATCSTTNLQLHHNFRWVLCANHMEPVKGFLGRFLRRRLLESRLSRCDDSLTDLERVFDWLPTVWQHLNKFLETHSSSDVTIGPRLFLSCPPDCAGSQVWFTDLWNYSVVPYLMEAVREGLQLYGRRCTWEDPAQFICQTWPWSQHAVPTTLLRLRPEDVGYHAGAGGSSVKSLSSAQSDHDADPLLNMLMRLQEAANYSSPQSNDSDSTSIDSSQVETSRLESTI